MNKFNKKLIQLWNKMNKYLMKNNKINKYNQTKKIKMQNNKFKNNHKYNINKI